MVLVIEVRVHVDRDSETAEFPYCVHFNETLSDIVLRMS